MIFAAINWLSISINLLLVVFVVVCLLMALLILMQRPKQEGLGAAFGGGVTDQVFGARTTNVLQRGTVYLGSLFFILSLTLAILFARQTKQKTLLEPEKAVAAKTVTADAEKPAVETVPEGPKSLADELPAEGAEPEPAPAVDAEAAEPIEAPAADEPAVAPEEASSEGAVDSEVVSEEEISGAEEPLEPAAEENNADKTE